MAQSPAYRGTTVVIIGGGIAGSALAKALDPDFDVVLVDSKPFVEFMPAMVSTAFLPEAAFRERSKAVLHVEHTEYIKRGRVILGSVREISADGHAVVLENGEVLQAQFVVLATGVSMSRSFPLRVSTHHGLIRSVEERDQQLIDFRRRVEAANTVLIIGLGPAGLETATQILTQFPEKRLVLVNSAPEVLAHNKVSSRIKRKFETFLRGKPNVQLILGERVEAQGNNEFVTNLSRKRIVADLMIETAGLVANSAPLRAHHAQHLDEKGFVKVDECLSLAGLPHVFAIGDVASLPVLKAARNTKPQVDGVFKHLHALMKQNKRLAVAVSESPATIIESANGSAMADFSLFAIVGWGEAGSSMMGGMKAGFIPTMAAGLRG